MIRREYVREPSRAANLALPPAVFALVLALVATIAHRTGALAAQNFVLVVATVFVVALLASIFALFGFYALWTRAAIGGRRSAWSLFLAAPVIVTGLLAVGLLITTAKLSDVSTDLLDPPHFSAVYKITTGMNINEPPRLIPVEQARAYPDVTGRRYALAAETIAAHAMRQVQANGWQLLSDKPNYAGNGEWLVDASLKTPLFGFIDDVVIRITDEGEATYVDMRSASRYGDYDLGSNARRIKQFMRDLDVRVTLRTQ